MIRGLLFYLIVIQVELIVTYKVPQELKNAPPDHVIPYTEHENPPEPPTKPKYIGPGEWAKPPADKKIPLDFVPTRLYAQVRKTDTVKRVPRQEALDQAETDEEKENAGRLKEVVSKHKINTVYTEEGYEDAAYDHGGHARDTDFQENYEEDTEKPEENINQNYHEPWLNTDVNPKFITENEIAKLTKDLQQENAEATKKMEIEIPDNLKNLEDEPDSVDYEDKQDEATRRDFDYDDETTGKHEYITTTSAESIMPTFISPVEINSTYPSIPGFDMTSTLRKLSSSEDPPTATDYGKVFWDYYKRQKPSHDLTIDNSQPYPEHRRMSDTTEEDISESSEDPKYHPSFLNIYNRQARGRKAYRQSQPKPKPQRQPHKKNTETTEADDYSSEEITTTQSPEKNVRRKKKQKPYTIILRAPPPPCNNTHDESSSESRNTKEKYANILDSSEEYEAMNNQANNDNLNEPPEPLGEVTYKDFLSNPENNPMQPSITQESGSLQEINSETVGPVSPELYRYQQQQRHRTRPTTTDRSMRNSLVRLITMLPPSPVSRSQYAQYQRRNGNARPQHDLWPEVFRNYRPVLRLDGRTTGSLKKLFNVDKRLNNEKVPVNSVKNVITRLARQLIGARKKRNVENLLNDAPEIVEDVIDKEIQSRFPDNDNDDDDEVPDKHFKSSDDYKENEFKIHVPEFDFTEVINNNGEHEPSVAPSKAPDITVKYPFYNMIDISPFSPLKYVLNPRQVPKKTLGGTEFYDSRDRYMKCDEVEPNLSEVLPEEDEPVAERGPETNLPRLRGLGDQLECLRDKYFDKNPLDNPLFTEQIVPATVPVEFELTKLKSRVSNFDNDRQATNIIRVSRKPEIIDLRPNLSRRNQINDYEQLENDKKKPRFWNNHAKRYRKRPWTTTEATNVAYEKQVYDDVMGTIKNMATMHQSIPLTLKIPKHPSQAPTRQQNVIPRPNYSPNPPRTRNENDQTGYMSSLTPPSSVPPQNPTPIAWRYKFVPYRTSKVTYRMRPRTGGPNSGQIVGYYKTVRVHKRSIDPPTVDLFPGESRIISNASTATKRRSRRPSSTQPPETSFRASEKVVYTNRDQMRNLKPRGSIRYGQFPIKSTAATDVDIRRNEPRYSSIRKVDSDIYGDDYYKDKNEESAAARKEDDEEFIEEYDEEPKKERPQYDVHESVEEKPTKSPADRDDKHDNSEESQSDHLNNSENHEEEENNKSNYEEENSEEQMEKPSYSTGSNEDHDDETSGETGKSGSYQPDDKTEEPDGEREFDHFVSRPFAPYDSFDGFSKPAFEHPSFSSLMSPSKSWKFRSSDLTDRPSGSRSYGYDFPWHKDDADTSEESRRHERITGEHEFPWETRERLAKERGHADDSHEGGSETMDKFWTLYPWDKSKEPANDYETSKVRSYFWPDTSHNSSGIGSKSKPTEFIGAYRKPIVYANSRAHLNNWTELNDVTTMSNHQIPPTYATYANYKSSPTTPTIPTTSRLPVYTIRTRPKTKKRSSTVIRPTIHTMKLNPTRLSKRHDNRVLMHYNPNRRKLRMPTTTPTLKRRNFNLPETKTTTPTTQKVEHRSKVSKEEIITMMSFPEGDSAEPVYNKMLPGKKEMVRKVSIVTKETPEHIYRTEEIDRDGVKGTYVSIIPNNNTKLLDSAEIMAIDRIDVDSIKDPEGTASLDISLPVPEDAVKLNEHGTRKIISSSISWITENYDY